MKHHHRGRTIFIFLGILILIFLIIFGMKYFESDYSFQDVDLGLDTIEEYQEV